jgi:hypothetical protein
MFSTPSKVEIEFNYPKNATIMFFENKEYVALTNY